VKFLCLTGVYTVLLVIPCAECVFVCAVVATVCVVHLVSLCLKVLSVV
jgi:hypothetical protein